MIFELFGKYFHRFVPANMGSAASVLSIKVDESGITNEQVISDNLNELFIDVASKLE